MKRGELLKVATLRCRHADVPGALRRVAHCVSDPIGCLEHAGVRAWAISSDAKTLRQPELYGRTAHSVQLDHTRRRTRAARRNFGNHGGSDLSDRYACRCSEAA